MVLGTAAVGLANLHSGTGARRLLVGDRRGDDGTGAQRTYRRHDRRDRRGQPHASANCLGVQSIDLRCR